MSRLLKFLAVLLVAMVFYTSPAEAQATRTWVSGVGDDANPCSRTAPCKTFAGAISKTAAGGEINCLDPGGFGAVTITKSITIDCTGTIGSVLASLTTGIIVNDSATATPGTIRVILRGLSINGGPPTSPGVNGIRFISGASLTVENVIIQNFTAASPNGFGISFRPNPGQLGRLVVTNSVIVNNGSSGAGGGILVQPTGASSSARVTLDNVQVAGNSGAGISITTAGATGADVGVIVTRSQIANSANGISVASAPGQGGAGVVVSDTVIANHTTGVLVSGSGASARISNSVITGNGTGVSPTGGGFTRSIGGNLLDANGSNGTFSDTIPKV
jgi:hypothetical protein